MRRLFAWVSFLTPRSLSLLVGLLALWGVFQHAFSEDEPLGSIEGIAVAEFSGRPLPNASVILGDSSYHTRTDSKGRFHFFSVPAGNYFLSIQSEHHRVPGFAVEILEGDRQHVTVPLARTEPELEVLQHARVFTTHGKAHLSVTGYVDAKAPAKKDHFRLRLFRTRVSQVLKSTERIEEFRSYSWGQNAKQGVIPNNFLKPAGLTPPNLALNKEIKIRNEDVEGFYYQEVALDKLQRGFYLMDIEHKGTSVWSWLMVTDTAVILKRHSRHLLAFATERDTGTPLPNVTLRTFLKEKQMLVTKTNAEGVSEMHLPLPLRKEKAEGGEDESDSVNGSNLWLIAQNGDDEAILTENFYQENADTLRIHAYTDRPVYRPGQTISYKVITRRLKPAFYDETLPVPQGAEASRPYTIPAGVPVKVKLLDTSGETLGEQSLTTNGYGSTSGTFKLDADATTGVYTLASNVEGQKFTHDVVIASYQKPEYTVTVSPEKPWYIQGEMVEMTISGQYYFGAPMVGTSVEYQVYSNNDWSSELPDDYEFEKSRDMPKFAKRAYFYGVQQDVSGTISLDANGKAKIRFPANLDNDGFQAHIYTMSVDIKDGKERTQSVEGTVSVFTGDYSLTVRPDGELGLEGVAKSVVVLARDHTGKPVPNLSIDLESRYEWWDDKKEEVVGKPAGRSRGTTGANGEVTFSVVPTMRGDLTLKAKALDSKGRAIEGNRTVWVSGETEVNAPDTTPDKLRIIANKRSYAPGENATVQINTEVTGQNLLLTIEGDRLYHHQVVPIHGKSTVLQIPIRADYGPNISLVACYVSKGGMAQSETTLKISQPQQSIRVQITPDRLPNGDKLARYQPGDQIKYLVQTTDPQGKPLPCEFSLAVVDESIFALQADSPSAIRDNFYPSHYNRVSTTSSFAVEYLGDADKAEPKISARKRFPDTLYWSPTLQTDAQGKATITVPLQDSLTTWRATVIAHTKETEVGWSTCKLLTAKDFLLRVQNPRFLTQYDHSQITAIVHNETGERLSARVRLKADTLKIDSETTREVELAPGEQKMLDWNVAAPLPGNAPLRVTAWTVGGTKQYTDGVELSLPVHPMGREEITTMAGQALSARPSVEVVRYDPHASPDYSRLTVRLTPTLLTAITGSLEYLIDYPYGCVEQTTSRFLADLAVQKLLKTRGITQVARASEIPKMVHRGIVRLRQMHNAGTQAWGWWQYDQPDLWMTSYALRGLITAKQEGYAVPEGFLEQAIQGAIKLLEATKDSSRNTYSERAMLLYALTMAGEGKRVETTRKQLDLKQLDTEALAYIALADRMQGKTISQIMSLINRRAQRSEGRIYWSEEGSGFFRSDLSTTSTVLRLLVAVNRNDNRIPQILHWIMNQRTESYWRSTRDTVSVLLALADYLSGQPTLNSGGKILVRLNGQPYQTFDIANMDKDKDTVLRIPTSRLQTDKNDISIERVGGGSPLFYSIESRQFIATEELKEKYPTGYRIVREYLRLTPHTTKDHKTILEAEETNNQLRTGENIRVRLTLYTAKALDHVLIEDPFPAGCTVSERGTPDEVMETWGYWWSSIDVRDKKIAFFASKIEAGKHIIEYNLKAQTPGTYNLLPTFLQPMYTPSMRADTASTRVRVN